MADSKPLSGDDESGALFVREMLQGDPTYGVNFDRVQWDTDRGKYVVVELLLCDEKQFSRGITPFTSHPNRYFNLNGQKFMSLWKLSQAMNADLYLVNYSKAGTQYADQVLVMEVTNVDPSATVKVETKDEQKLTREQFSQWFRAMNRRGRT